MCSHTALHRSWHSQTVRRACAPQAILRKRTGIEGTGGVQTWTWLQLPCADGGGHPRAEEAEATGPILPSGSLGDLLRSLALLSDAETLRCHLGEADARQTFASFSTAVMAEAFGTVCVDVIDSHARQE